MPKKKPQTFEEQYERLEEIVERLESDDVALEESLALYAEGMELVRLCGKKLTDAQQKIEKINAAMKSDANDDTDE